VYRWCRRCTVVTFALVVFGTTAALVLLARIYTDSDSVRQLVTRFVDKRIADGVFGAGRAKYQIGNTLTVEDLSITVKDRQGVHRNILSGGDLTVQPDTRGLASGRITVRKMTLADPELNFHFDKDGRCAFFKFRKAADETTVREPIVLDVTNGAIKLTFESPTAVPITFTDVSGRIDYDPNAKVTVDLRGRTQGCHVTLAGEVDVKNKHANVTKLAVDGAPLGKLLESLPPSLKGSLPSGVFALGKANVSGVAKVAWRDDQPKIEGMLTATMLAGAAVTPVKSARLAGSFDARTGVLEVAEASLVDADLAAALPLVPAQHRGKIAAPETLRGRLSVNAQGKIRTKEKPFGWEGKATAELTQAGWSPPQSPYPITGAAATVEVTPAGFMVKKAVATVGPAKATASGLLPDWDCNRARIAFNASNLPFDKEVRDRLPPRLQELWDKFQPEGSVSATGEAAMNGGTPRFVGQVALHDNAITFDRFPYRVVGGQGCVDFKPDGRVEYDLVGTVGGGLAKLTGTVADLSPLAEMDLVITGSDVTLDDDLRRAFEAIKPAHDAISRVHAVGKGRGTVRIKRRQGSRIVRVESDVELDLRNFHADWFPYLFDRVTGKVVVNPERVEFADCVATTASGAAVRMTGWSQRDGPVNDAGEPTGSSYLQLDFEAIDLPINRKLREAIPAKYHSALDQLRPEGAIAFTARFVQPTGKPFSIAFRVDASKAAVTPTAFPYRLHDIVGPIRIDGEVVSWGNLVARHGDVEWRCTSGYIDTKRDAGGGELHFDRIGAPSLPFDDDLKAAVPPNVRSVLEFLSPSVPAERVSLDDFTVIWGAPGAAPTFEIGEAKVHFVNADLAPSIGARNVTGQVTLSGACTDAPDFDGNIYLHSITMAGMKATSLQSRLLVNGPRISFERLKADFYGGELHAPQLHAILAPVPAYEARLTVMHASLKDYVRQTMDTEMPLDGEVSANLRLHGRGESIGRLTGDGDIVMRRVDVLRLPILLDQIDFLLTKLPEGKTFDQAKARFSLNGSRMSLSEFSMSSKMGAFSLQRREGLVDLSTGRLDLHVVYELTRGLRLPGAGLTALHIGGTFGNPEIRPAPARGLRGIFSSGSR
jgi:hypothetical protein